MHTVCYDLELRYVANCKGYALIYQIHHFTRQYDLISCHHPLSPQYEVRMKTVAQTLLAGRKRHWLYQQRWLGDEFGKAVQGTSSNHQFVKQASVFLGTVSIHTCITSSI